MQIIHRLAGSQPSNGCPDTRGGRMLTAANAITNLDIHAGELGNQISQVNSGGFPTDSGPRCVKVGHVKTKIRLHSDAGITREWKKTTPRRILKERRHPVGSAYFDIPDCPRTALTWCTILLQSNRQAYWFIRRHGTTGTAAVAHSASSRLLHQFLNKQLLTLLHKQAELWSGTLSSSSANANEEGSNSKWRAAEGPAGCQRHGDSSSTTFTAMIYDTVLLAEQWEIGLGLFILGEEGESRPVFTSPLLFRSSYYCIHNLQNQCYSNPAAFYLPKPNLPLHENPLIV